MVQILKPAERRWETTTVLVQFLQKMQVAAPVCDVEKKYSILYVVQ